jgi:cation:H+ antiporter
MVVYILYLIGGLVAILWGANTLTDGAASVAKRFRLSNLVIGLTIVAFGTSMPEFVISLLSALQGSADLAIGNVVGSNIFNTLAIVGCTAIVSPIFIGKGTLNKEIPFTLLASIILFLCANDQLLGNESVSNGISRKDGLLLLCFFVMFLCYTFAIARHHDTNEEETSIKVFPLWKAILFILLGLIGLIAGGKFFVEGASGIARAWGVSESIIGLTLVAGGTSLPELATSIVAALKKNPGIAIGNVIGSNLFNIFFVLGTSATICPMKMQGITNFDLLTLIGASALLWIFGFFYKKRSISRVEGIILVLVYAFYLYMLL